MSDELAARVAASLTRDVAPQVRELGSHLGREAGAEAVLFYGSNLRTGELDGVLDFYVLLPGEPETGIWPRVTYREVRQGETLLRAKIATMTLARFAEAAHGELLDTTIWARFCQPCAMVWTEGEGSANRLRDAVASAIATAARLAAVLGPPKGDEDEFWLALFGATYGAEFRVESGGRARSIIDLNRAHFDGLLGPALEAGNIAFDREGTEIAPRITDNERRRVLAWWKKRKRLGKAYNALRLLRASRTFDGAARYAAWKIERHTGVPVAVTPWRERHPVLAAPGVLWSVWKEKRRHA